MVDEVRTQLFMMLVTQPGSGALPLSSLSTDQFLPFVRRVEENLVRHALSPILVYWSSRKADWMLPDHSRYQALLSEAEHISIFSEDKFDQEAEFCFLIQSQGISMILYGHRSDENMPAGVYQCVGSIEHNIVKRGFHLMQPWLTFIDLAEANRLDDARKRVGNPVTAPHFSYIRNEWPVVKQRAITPPIPFTGSTSGVIPILAPARESALPIPQSAAESDDRTNALKRVILPTGSTLGSTQMVARPGDDVTQPAAEVRAAVSGSHAQTLPVPPPSEPNRDQPMPPLKSAAQRHSGGNGSGSGSGSGGGGGKALPSIGSAGAWTNITQEVRITQNPDAQRIIKDIIYKLRLSSDLHNILQFAIKELARVANADRGLIWQIADNSLVVTNEYSRDGNNCFTETRSQLATGESTAIVSEFLERFPDETGSGVIAIPDVRRDTTFRRLSPTLNSLLELGSVNARLVAQIKCRGSLHGFIELQHRVFRDWTEQDAAILQSVSEVLSLVVQQSSDLAKMERDANEMKLINELSEIFRDSSGQHAQDTIERSVRKFAEHTNFKSAQLFLLNWEEKALIPQMNQKEYSTPIPLAAKNNPFLQVYETGKLKVYNKETTKRGDPFFGQENVMLIPLMSEGEKVGVLALWGRKDGVPPLRPQDEELALTVAGSLSSSIRADQAIAQIREERERHKLLNTVSNEIQQSLKEVGPVLSTLVESVADHFQLSLCVISIYDANLERFSGSKCAGTLVTEPDSLMATVGEHLFQYYIERLKDGDILFCKERSEINPALQHTAIEVPSSIKLTLLMPLRQGSSLKGALCLMSSTRDTISVADMQMLKGLLEYVSVVLAHKEVYEQVERQAVTDPMTGLYNRRYFQEQLSKEFDRCQRYGHPLSYIIVDLDYLKKINDTLGHQFGDAAIKHIAQVLRKCIRDNVDTTARYGGEEFIVLLPETDVEGAKVVAERMCQAIREKEVEGIGTVTASIGVCTFPYDTQDREQLTELADQALYLAKHRGRNRVCTVWHDLMPSLKERGEEALHITQEAVKKKTQELPAIDLKLIAEHGILGLLGTVIKMIEERDAYGTDRSPRAAEYASRISLALRLSKEHTTIISLSAILNNLGKIAIDEEVLKKQGPLSTDEKLLMQSSPSMAAKILEPAKHLHRVASVVEAYHEHWDGTGYPKGLKGEEIPLESRIIALVDAYVAMTSNRPYRKALSKQKAIEELQSGSGNEWDPRLVKIFLGILAREDREQAGGQH